MLLAQITAIEAVAWLGFPQPEGDCTWDGQGAALSGESETATCIHIYIYRAYLCTFTCICKHVNMHICMYIGRNTHAYTCAVYIYLYTYTYTCSFRYMHSY